MQEKNMQAQFQQGSVWINITENPETWNDAFQTAGKWNEKFNDKTQIVSAENGSVSWLFPAKVAIPETHFSVEVLEKFPENSNPYHHDFSNMGTPIAKNCEVMYSSRSNGELESIIVVNTKTGERIRINF